MRAAALAATVALVACGGGGGDAAPDTPPTPTEITTQPASVSVLAGADAAFSVTARGDNLAYQWQTSTDRGASWTDIAGATAAAYTRRAVDSALDGHQFRVQVRGSAGSLTSSAATLTVTALTPVTILAQPADQSVLAGARATFDVTAAGTAPAYRWQRSPDGQQWTDIAGATTSSLVFDPAALVNDGIRVRVIVANAAGSVTSASALLRVQAPPSAPVITTQPAAVAVVAPQPASFTVVAGGSAPLAYQWQRSSDGGVSWADITGATAASLTLNPTAVGDNGLRLRVRVSNGAGSVVSDAALLSVTVAAAVPRFIVPPQGQTVVAPASASFSVVVDGSPAPTLQWQSSSDGGATFANINGATQASYTTPATTLSDNLKLFRVVATNAAGSSTSPAVPLMLSGLLGFPYAVAIDSRGDLLISALPNVQTGSNVFAGLIQFRTASFGATGTLAGSPLEGFINGTGAGARFSAPVALAAGLNGTVYAAEVGNRVVRRISAAGVVSTFAGTGATGFQDGPVASATFFGPNGLALDAAGTLYVADGGWNTIRRIGSDGVVSTVAGLVNTPGFVDGSGTAARFSSPRGLAVDAAGNVFVADRDNNAIRRMTPAGVVTTLAGGGTSGVSGFLDATGRAARFNDPHAVAVDGAGNVYVADRANHAIRKITPAGVVTTLAGNGSAGATDGAGPAARFSAPQGIAVDAAGNVYVADTGNRAVRRIAPDGVVSTLLR